MSRSRTTTTTRVRLTATDRDESATNATNTINITRNRYKGVSGGAPVVDSALLRFISQQKKIPGVYAATDETSGARATTQAQAQNNNNITDTNTNNNSVLASSFSTSALPTTFTTNGKIRNSTSSFAFGADAGAAVTAASSSSSSLAAAAADEEEETQPIETTDNNNNGEDEDWVVKNTMMNAESTTETSTSSLSSQAQPQSQSQPQAAQSWMVQFSSKNIEQTLMDNSSNGNEISDRSIAKVAGDAVERYCVVRTARRSIRRFLKERDNLWASSSSSDGGDGSSSSSRQELETLAAFAAASSPAASLLLSYAEQQQKETQNDVDADDLEDDEDSPVSPTYKFQDVIDVMKGYGLTSNDICVLLTHSPNLALRAPRKSFIIASQETTDDAEDSDDSQDHDESLEETLERSLKGLLQTTLGLRRYDARKVLRQCPTLVTVRGSKSAVQIIKMMTTTGVSTSSLSRDKNGLPTLLSRSPAGLFRLISFLSSTAVRMPLDQIGPLLRRKIGRNLLDAVNPVPPLTLTPSTVSSSSSTSLLASTLSSDDESSDEEIEIEDPRELWYRNRAERKAQIERTYGEMTRTSQTLQKQIGTNDLSKVISAYPAVLLLDAEKQILPVARYLMGGLGIWEDDLSSLLQLYPTLLGKRIDDLEKVVSYLVDELGVEEDDLGQIFRSFPVLFSLDIKNDMEPVVAYLKEHCNVKDIGSFITRLPPVLGYSVKKEIQPKWEFLKKMTLKPEYELNSFPAYFSYPFHRVIKTRFNYLAYKNIFWFSSNRIDTVLRFGDIDFATKIALDDDDGESYKVFGGKSSIRSCSKSGKDVVTTPWRTTKRRNKNRRSSTQSRSSRILGQSPPKSFRDSKKYLRREAAAAAAAAKESASSSELTKSERSKAKAAAKAASAAAKSANAKTTAAMASPLFSLKKKQKQGRRRRQQDDEEGTMTSTSSAMPSPA